MDTASPPSTPSNTGVRLRRVSSSEKAKQRDEELVLASAAGPVPQIAQLLQENAVPCLHLLTQAINLVGPLYLRLLALGTSFYDNAPMDLIQAATGLGLCFFGLLILRRAAVFI